MFYERNDDKRPSQYLFFHLNKFLCNVSIHLRFFDNDEIKLSEKTIMKQKKKKQFEKYLSTRALPVTSAWIVQKYWHDQHLVTSSTTLTLITSTICRIILVIIMKAEIAKAHSNNRTDFYTKSCYCQIFRLYFYPSHHAVWVNI